MFDFYQACRHDDEYVFFGTDPSLTTHTRGNYIYREGASACGTDIIKEECTFFMEEEQDAVRIYFELPDSKPFNYKIRKIYTVEELTQTTLVFSYKIQAGSTVYVWREFYKLK